MRQSQAASYQIGAQGKTDGSGAKMQGLREESVDGRIVQGDVMPGKEKRCDTCRFWHDDAPEDEPYEEDFCPEHPIGIMHLVKPGTCCRFPPHPCPPEGRIGRPITEYTDWCGEWQPLAEVTKVTEQTKPVGREAIRISRMKEKLQIKSREELLTAANVPKTMMSALGKFLLLLHRGFTAEQLKRTIKSKNAKWPYVVIDLAAKFVADGKYDHIPDE